MPTAERMSVVLMKARNLNPPFSDWNTESRPISKSQKPRICAGLHNRYFMSQARRTRHFARKGNVSSPRLAPRAKCHVRHAWLIKPLICRLDFAKGPSSYATTTAMGR